MNLAQRLAEPEEAQHGHRHNGNASEVGHLIVHPQGKIQGKGSEQEPGSSASPATMCAVGEQAYGGIGIRVPVLARK